MLSSVPGGSGRVSPDRSPAPHENRESDVDMSDRVKVLFILGTTRCGSTILENVLGSAPGFFAAGEIHMLWRGMARGFRCGCGQEIASCPFWSAVLTEVGSPDDPNEVYRWQLAQARMLHTPRLLRTDRWPVTGRADLDRYVDLLRRLYPEVRRASGADVIVDSSKTPAAAAILERLDEIDLSILHLVRDPRGVAFSWERGRPAGEDAHGPREYSPGPVRTSGRWVSTNVLGDSVRRRLPAARTMLLRYEDFAEHPKQVVEAICRFVGAPSDRLPFIDDRTVRLAVGHAVSGNRSRFSEGDVEIRLDDAWRRAPRSTQLIASTLTAPWLGRYGYRWKATS
jgi:hypothetical protein